MWIGSRHRVRWLTAGGQSEGKTRGVSFRPSLAHSHTYTCTTHAGPTHAHGARNNNTHGAHITARVHMAAQNEGGGRGQREGGWGWAQAAGHTYMNAWENTHLYTRNSTQHYHTEGWQGGKGSKPKWTHSRKKQKTVPFVHTHQQGIKQHMRCVTALREERGVGGCGWWGTALVQCWGGRTTGTTEPWGVGVKEARCRREREDEANGPNTRDVKGSAPQ